MVAESLATERANAEPARVSSNPELTVFPQSNGPGLVVDLLGIPSVGTVGGNVVADILSVVEEKDRLPTVPIPHAGHLVSIGFQARPGLPVDGSGVVPVDPPTFQVVTDVLTVLQEELDPIVGPVECMLNLARGCFAVSYRI